MMKAKCVYENIDFERGKDPISSMGIGRKKNIVKDLMKIINNVSACKGVYLVDSPWPRYTKPFRRDNTTHYQLQFTGDSYAGFRRTFKSDLNRELKEFGFQEYLEFPGRDVGRGSKDHWIYYLIKEGKEDMFSEVTGGITSFDARRAQREGLLESAGFERGLDAKDALRVGRKWKWNMSPEELSAEIIMDVETDDDFKKIVSLTDREARRRGFEDFDDYWVQAYDEDGNVVPGIHDKELEDIADRIWNVLEKILDKYPWIHTNRGKEYMTPKERVVSAFVQSVSEGIPHGTLFQIIIDNLDKSYLRK